MNKLVVIDQGEANGRTFKFIGDIHLAPVQAELIAFDKIPDSKKSCLDCLRDQEFLIVSVPHNIDRVDKYTMVGVLLQAGGDLIGVTVEYLNLTSTDPKVKCNIQSLIVQINKRLKSSKQAVSAA